MSNSSGKFDINGWPVWFERFGTGKDVILLIPGAMGELWVEWVFEKNYSVSDVKTSDAQGETSILPCEKLTCWIRNYNNELIVEYMIKLFLLNEISKFPGTALATLVFLI